MKAVIVGFDFMYNHDGVLVPIEMNTNIALDFTTRRITQDSDIYHLEAFSKFCDENGIKEVYVKFGHESVTKLFKEAFNILRPDIPFVVVDNKGWEDLEDGPEKLIIRIDYSDSAAVDTYCADKIKFKNLYKGFDKKSEFIYKENGVVHGTITTIHDNGTIPNFLVKYRYPYYDKKVWPKLLHLSSLNEVQEYVENDLVDDYILEPYNYSEEKSLKHFEELNEDRIQSFRAIELFAALSDGTLKTITLGTYNSVAHALKELSYTGVELDSDCRGQVLIGPHSKSDYKPGDVLAEANDLVLMGDFTWKKASEIKVGDIVQSIDIPNPNNVDLREHTPEYNISEETLKEGTNFTSAKVLSVSTTKVIVEIVSLEFECGITWRDTRTSSYLVEDPIKKVVSFRRLEDIKVGDKVYLIKTDVTNGTVEFDAHIVSSVSGERIEYQGYGLTLDAPHIFLTREEGVPEGFASIEHNLVCRGNCRNTVCYCTGGTTCFVYWDGCPMGDGCDCTNSDTKASI